jgi:HAD superfamily phosphatase (TIGR01681 family)
MVNHTRYTKKQNGGGGETKRILKLVKEKYYLNILDKPEKVEISELVRLLGVYRKIKDGEMDNDQLFIKSIINNIDKKKDKHSKNQYEKSIWTKVKEQMAIEFEKIQTIIEKNTEYQQYIDKQEKAISRHNPVLRSPIKRKKVKQQLGVRPQYVLIFDYDHTLTNSYGDGNHSNGHSWNDEKSSQKFKVITKNESIYDATDKNIGNYAKLRNQLCTLKENGVLMFVNSRGIQEQLVKRLEADKLSEFFGIDDGSAENEMMEFKKVIVAKGNIGNGIYGAYGTRESNTIGRGDWHEIKLQVIEHILTQLKNYNTELHFFDDEDANVNAFNEHNFENIKTKVGHLIGQSSKRPGSLENSITQELNEFIKDTLKPLQECHNPIPIEGGYRKTLHKSKKSRKSKKTKKSSKKTSKKH